MKSQSRFEERHAQLPPHESARPTSDLPGHGAPLEEDRVLRLFAQVFAISAEKWTRWGRFWKLKHALFVRESCISQ